MKELQKTRQEIVNTCAEVCQAQHVEMLASSALAAARQAVDASTKRFQQVGAYQLLHMHLIQQSLRHVGDNNNMINVCNLLHCQLQASGRPSSPPSDSSESSLDLNGLLA